MENVSVIYPEYDHKNHNVVLSNEDWAKNNNSAMVNEEWVKNVTDRMIEFEAALMSKLK